MKERNLIPFFLIFGVGWLVYLRLGDIDRILHISREDGLVEYATALFYFIGFIVGIYSIKARKKYALPISVPIIWTFLCFFFLGEEVSWFQRIFNYSVSSVEAVSKQGEFNLHNLMIFSEGAFISEGKINKMTISEMLFSSQNLFRLGFFSYFLIIPVLCLNKKIKAILQKMGYLKPSWTAVGIVFIVFLFSFLLAVLSPVEFKPPIAESREMLYALFILIYVILYIKPDKELVV